MKLRTTTLAIILLAAGGSVGLSDASDSEPSWSDEQQEVIDAASRGPVGIEEDFDGWAAGYHAEWSYWRLGADSTRPRGEHMGLVRDYLGEGNRVVGFEIEALDVIVRGDVAMLRYNAVETIEEADGAKRVVCFSSASMYEKVDGRWLCLATNIFYPPAEE